MNHHQQQKDNIIEQEQKQKETQEMKIIDKQQQQEVQYYVYADLKNFLGILTDVTETLKFFDGTQDAAFVPVAINKLVLQSNLSNGIHFDLEKIKCLENQDVNKEIYKKPEKEDLQKNLNKLIAQQKLAQQYPQVAQQNKQKINQDKQELFNEIK